jgi:hypothetical protein
MISKPMPLIILPIPNIKLLIIIEALSYLAVSSIFFPEAVVLVAGGFFAVGAGVSAEAVALFEKVDISFKRISIRILYSYYISILLLTTLRPI